MRGLRLLLVFLCVCLGGQAWANPQAHWSSEKQIQLYYSTFHISANLQFQLVTDDPALTKPLNLQERHGDLWVLSADPLRDQMRMWVKRPLWVRVLDNHAQEIFRTPLRLVDGHRMTRPVLNNNMSCGDQGELAYSRGNLGFVAINRNGNHPTNSALVLVASARNDSLPPKGR